VRRGLFRSVRARFVGTYVVLLALATAGSVLVAEQVVVDRLDARISRELEQESEELRRLAGGIDPLSGEPFANDVRRIFRVYLERNIPSHDEALLTFVDGVPFLRSRPAHPVYRLDLDRELVARWANVTGTDRGRVDTPAGGVDYMAVPIRSRGETLGVFVVAQFRDEELRELRTAAYAIAAVGVLLLLVGSLLAWRLAGKVLRPVREVTAAARSISDTDLSRRIPVSTKDEIAELGATFNEMLDRLERAFATQRRFLRDAGHELRTPITIVRGHLELLEHDPDMRQRTIAIATDELDRMSRMVNELLELARAEEPAFLSVGPVDLAALTDEMYAKATALASREWVLERRAEGMIVADRQRLTQAVVELAHNAVQHAGGSETIELGSAVVNGAAHFWVRDRGPGIPMDEQEHVFARFGRGAGRRRGDGAGLGLAIVNAIAKAHGGRVDLESGPAAGATFTVVIPTSAAPGARS
jgi:two-component system OmpR family sensor kinase